MTPQQQQALKADIIAKQAAGQPLDGVTDDLVIANYYNQIDPSATKVWDNAASVSDVLDAINWSRFTPNADVSNTGIATQLAAEQASTQMLAIQTKQMNLQNIILGRTSIDATKGNVRAGLMDAVTNLPAGNNGSPVSAAGTNGINVLNALLRAANASIVEKLLSTGAKTTGDVTADVLGYYGPISYTEVSLARQS